MTYQNVYETALTLLGYPPRSLDVEDYKERSANLLGMISAELRPLSDALGYESSEPYSTLATRVNLGAGFMLDKRLAFPAAAKLASMLIAEENPTLSAALKICANDLLTRIENAATVVSSTKEVYS